MEKQRKLELITMFIYLIASIIIGYLSFWLKNPMLSFVIAIFVLVIIAKLLKKIYKINEKFSWFMSNGGIIYIFLWIIVWTILYNL
ncbi:MAG: hypothetical protein J7K26_01380 [Candidatus Aenigmarchaeota archaeon]|nr:hypothetical protein [Candidatus Aenigmarchaeota archaeon]